MIIFDFEPYIRVGEFVFGMHRNEAMILGGELLSTTMYGFPREDRFLDNYGFMHLLYNNKQLLEAVELFPDISKEELAIRYKDKIIILERIASVTMKNFSTIANDIVSLEENDGFESGSLGLKIFCPEEIVEDVIIHDLHCYDEENEYLRSL